MVGARLVLWRCAALGTVVFCVAGAGVTNPSRADASPPTEKAEVAADFTRVAALLPGWRSAASPLAAATCPVPASTREVTRIARVFSTSGGRTGLATQVGVAVVAFPSARTSRQAQAQARKPSTLSCLREAITNDEEHRFHRHARVEISLRFPSWVPRDRAHSLEASTITVWKNGYRLPKVTTKLALPDPVDPSIRYEFQITQAEGSIPTDLIQRLLAAAERRPVPLPPMARTYRYDEITCETDPHQEDIFCGRSDGHGTSIVLAPLVIFAYTAKGRNPSFTHVNLGGRVAINGRPHPWFVFNYLACVKHSRGTVFCARADHVGYGFAISRIGLTIYRLSDMKPVFHRASDSR